MKPPAPPRSLSDLRGLTPARVALGRAGVSLPTSALLDFTLAHARARDAVHTAFDVAALHAGLHEAGFEPLEVLSCASNRRQYLARPDLGRRLDPASLDRLRDVDAAGQLAIVIGDGLSAAAVHAHALPLVRELLPQLGPIKVGAVIVATGARVALGDEIGALLGAKMVAALIGERPGLSTPDSLGAYLTFAPREGLTDADRNCVSNIHGAGLSYPEAAIKIAWLVREGLARQVTGVALKDESGDVTSQLAAGGGVLE